jgi:hypothetical protein
MKNLPLLIYFSLLFSHCKHDIYMPDCNCSNLDSYINSPNGYYGTQEGMIIFPKPFSKEPYRILADKDFTGYANGKPVHTLCTDSTLIKQIQDKQIKDSSKVILTGVGAFIHNGYLQCLCATDCHQYARRC